jgi:hypothetical protein
VTSHWSIVRALIRGLVRAGVEHIAVRCEDDGSATLLADGEVVLSGVDLLALRASLRNSSGASPRMGPAAGAPNNSGQKQFGLRAIPAGAVPCAGAGRPLGRRRWRTI